MARKKKKSEGLGGTPATPATETILVELDRIRTDGKTQARVKHDREAVADYAAAYEAGEVQMPPLEVCQDGDGQLWLWDGFHRLEAARSVGVTQILCRVTIGSVEDARWLSLGANAANGIRRTNEDKRNAVTLALRARPDMSDRAIAEHVGVSQPFVGKVREEIGVSDNRYQIRTVTRGDQTYTVNTTNIGKTAEQPTDEEDAWWPGEAADTDEQPTNDNHDETPTTPQDAEGGGPGRDDHPATQTPTSGGGGEPTAPKKEEEKPPTDVEGVPLPDQAREAFSMLPEMRKLARAIDDASREAERLGKSACGRCLHWQSMQSHLASAKNSLNQAMPTHVCPYCKGRRAKCDGCKGQGWVTRSAYKAAPGTDKESA